MLHYRAQRLSVARSRGNPISEEPARKPILDRTYVLLLKLRGTTSEERGRPMQRTKGNQHHRVDGASAERGRGGRLLRGEAVEEPVVLPALWLSGRQPGQETQANAISGAGTAGLISRLGQGTVMEGSNLPLRKWLLAIYLMHTSRKGVVQHADGAAHRRHAEDGVVPRTPHPRGDGLQGRADVRDGRGGRDLRRRQGG